MESTADEIPTGAQFEAQTIALARQGDADAGMEAIETCIAGLYANRLSEPMRFYLAQCLIDLVGGMKPTRAMNIEVERGRGRPANPFPEWEMPLAAFGALLHRRGYSAARIEEAMDRVRQSVYQRPLDPREARRIRKKYRPMQEIGEADLFHLCKGDDLRGLIAEYSPVSKTL